MVERLKNISLSKRIFLIVLAMSELLAIVISIAVAYNYQNTIKSYYGSIGKNIGNQLLNSIDIENFRKDFENENISDEIKQLDDTIYYYVNHYSLHDIKIFALYDNYVKYIVSSNDNNYYNINFDNLSLERMRAKDANSDTIIIGDVEQNVETYNNDDTKSITKYKNESIATYTLSLGDINSYPAIFISINFLVDVINKQIKDFIISIIVFCSLTLIFESLIIYVYLRYLLIIPIENISDKLNMVKNENDLQNLDFEDTDINSSELWTFQKDIKNISNKFSKYSNLFEQSKLENQKSQFAIKTLMFFADERGLPQSFYDDNNEYYNLCGMFDSINNRINKNFYDYFMIDKYRLCILMLEVNHETNASVLFMDMLRDNIKNRTVKGDNIEDIFTDISKFMQTADWVSIGINAIELIINLKNGEAVFVVAGDIYCSILVDKGIYKEFCNVSFNRTPQFSIKSTYDYKSYKFNISKNEKIFIYSNELINIFSLDNNMYGKEMLLDVLNKNKNENTEKLYNILIDEISHNREMKNDNNEDCAFLLFELKKYFGDIVD